MLGNTREMVELVTPPGSCHVLHVLAMIFVWGSPNRQRSILSVPNPQQPVNKMVEGKRPHGFLMCLLYMNYSPSCPLRQQSRNPSHILSPCIQEPELDTCQMSVSNFFLMGGGQGGMGHSNNIKQKT